ncbi:ester cyclase [Flavihumibacter sp. R14]|nr:ester cyclase [Flavihumibacter soli]
MRNVQETLLYKWFDKVWNKDDENAIDELMTDDAGAKGILADDQPKGASGFKIFFNDFRNQFHDIKIDVEEVISEDDFESARTTVSAIHTESGKQVSFAGMCMVRIVNGKIGEAWNNYDFLGLYQQLGQKLSPVE